MKIIEGDNILERILGHDRVHLRTRMNESCRKLHEIMSVENPDILIARGSYSGRPRGNFEKLSKQVRVVTRFHIGVQGMGGTKVSIYYNEKRKSHHLLTFSILPPYGEPTHPFYKRKRRLTHVT